MTTTQKITYLRRFEELLNLIESEHCLPIGIVSLDPNDNTKAGFSPIFTEVPYKMEVYGFILNQISVKLLQSDIEKEVSKPINPRNQNLN